MKILVIPETYNNRFSACGWIRLIYPYLNLGKNSDYLVRIGDWKDIESWNPQLIVTQRIQANQSTEKYLQVMKNKGIKLIFDLDDDLLEIAESHPDRLHYIPFVESIKIFLESANIVTVSTAEMSNKIARYCKSSKIEITQNELPPQLWFNQVLDAGEISKASDLNGEFNLMYFGTSSHVEDWNYIKPEIVEWLSRNPECSLTLIGIADETQSTKNQIRVKKVPNFASASYPAFVCWLREFSKFEIGIAPLIDNPFNRSKSNLKALEYSSLGLIPLMSPVTPYVELENDFGIGTTVDSGSWGKVLDDYRDVELRKIKERQNIVKTEKQFTIHRTSPAQVKLTNILHEVF